MTLPIFRSPGSPQPADENSLPVNVTAPQAIEVQAAAQPIISSNSSQPSRIPEAPTAPALPRRVSAVAQPAAIATSLLVSVFPEVAVARPLLTAASQEEAPLSTMPVVTEGTETTTRETHSERRALVMMALELETDGL
jgi:hypothetical protein